MTMEMPCKKCMDKIIDLTIRGLPTCWPDERPKFVEAICVQCEECKDKK